MLGLLVGFSLVIVVTSSCDDVCRYNEARSSLVEAEESLSFDFGVPLTTQEQLVDSMLSKLRQNEIARFNTDAEFLTAANFRSVQSFVEKTKSFSLLKNMPKGGLLHTHAFGDAWSLLKQGSYDPECWINLGDGSGEVPQYIYSDSIPNSGSGISWKRVQDWRAEHTDPNSFDRNVLYPIIQFYTPPANISQDKMWEYFDLTIYRVATLASKESVWMNWVKEGLKALSDDGVIHIEVRGFMNFINIPGTGVLKYNDTQVIQIWKNILKEFNAGVPLDRQISMRFIYAASRNIPVDELIVALKATVELQTNNLTSDLVVGFDIVDEEDRFNSLIYYLKGWLFIASYLEERGLPPMSYYFHAAETDWYKDRASNLYDAVLLNSKRIGHGFAILNYPLLQEQFRETGVAIEVCPISNQLLRVVQDLREHPAREMMSNDLAITISSDDSVIYGYNGLTYDYWMAYTSWNLTLAGLKKLTQNGIQYSALPLSVKEQKLQQLDSLWTNWIADVVKDFLY